MKKTKSSRVSERDIAQAAGLSKAAVSYALQNRPKVSPATRRRVLRIAKQLGYTPDARIASWMTRVQQAKTKDLLPIAWLNTHQEKNAWHFYKFMSPYLEGAQKQALQSGYRIEEIWTQQPGMTMRRISQILDQRGIEGVIVSFPARHFRLNWDKFACVSLGRGLLAPRLHQVTADLYFNLLIALKMVKRFGYRRVGVCLDELLDRRHADHAIRSTIHYLNATIPQTRRVPPIFYRWRGGLDGEAASQVIKWIKRYKPDVIIGHSNYLIEWTRAAGYGVPEEIGIVHLATDDDVKDWAGIYSNKREIGANTVKLLVSMINTREFGLPKIATNTFVHGSWQPGRTLRIPKSK